MITFHSRQLDCVRRARKIENSGTFNFKSQISSSICTVAFTKCEKSDATIFTLRCSRTAVSYRFRMGHALPLTKARFFRLDSSSPMVARSPARRSRDRREISGKKSGKMSRVIFAQRPGIGETVATAVPPGVCQDDLQDNLPAAGHGRAMSAPETCKTTRNTVAQQPCRSPRNDQCSILRAACRILVINF